MTITDGQTSSELGTAPADSDAEVSAEELARRTVRQSDYVSCNTAFIDCRTPGSDLKENYSIIGSGVTQNPDQVINLEEPHGFNVGAAAMPHGVVNNLHMHFTAEVFLAYRGDWLLRWGPDGNQGQLELHKGDVVTVPTWIFRGFTNIGPDDGWLFTALGFDNTGGIIWAPSIIEGAGEYGLYLSADNRLIDTAAGDVIEPGTELISPMHPAELAALRPWTVEQMRSRVVTQADLNWSKEAFLCFALPGGGAEFAQVIGYGMTEDRDQVPPVHYPHNFNLGWLRAVTGEGLLAHRHFASQALVVYSGRWRVTLNRGAEKVIAEIGPDDTLSVPAGAWRRFEALTDDAQMAVINGGDGRVRLEWEDETNWFAQEKGYSHDAAGYVAPWEVVRTSVLDD